MTAVLGVGFLPVLIKRCHNRAYPEEEEKCPITVNVVMLVPVPARDDKKIAFLPTKPTP